MMLSTDLYSAYGWPIAVPEGAFWMWTAEEEGPRGIVENVRVKYQDRWEREARNFAD